MPKNVQKRRARPTQSIAKPGDDHELGLWIDYGLLRNRQDHAANAAHVSGDNGQPLSRISGHCAREGQEKIKKRRQPRNRLQPAMDTMLHARRKLDILCIGINDAAM